MESYGFCKYLQIFAGRLLQRCSISKLQNSVLQGVLRSSLTLVTVCVPSTAVGNINGLYHIVQLWQSNFLL